MIAQNIAFGILAASMAGAAVKVVTTKNVVHAALYLTMVLAGVAGIFVLLAAEFVAVVQIIVYVGAIVVLFLFGVMLTRAPIGRESSLDNDQRWAAAAVALFLFGVLCSVLINAFHRVHVAPTEVQRTGDVAVSIFQTYVVPFEVVSIVLLAALLGAVVIARRD